MNKFTFTTALLFITGFTLSGYAQTKTKFGDDVGTLNGIIKAFYASMSVKKGQLPSYERDSLLHYPGALVGLPDVDKSGKTVMRMVNIKQFHDEEDASMAKTGYYEK